MIDTNALTKLVPGFDFLQGLMNSAGQAVPAMGQWVAPTLDPAELDKRIGELKTVQFWLEQNARMIGTTIQALEVQRMTLATLQTMNLPMADLRQAMTLPEKPAKAARAAPRPAEAPPAAKRAEAGPGDAAKAGGIDPMQWWGALTQQFGQLAAKAVQDGQAIAASTLAAATAPGAAAAPAAAQAGAKASAKAGPRAQAAPAGPKRAARKAPPAAG